MKDELKPYIKLVDFIADALGENSEVVLHDLIDFNNSIVAIRNGHISGREVGGPATDLVLKVMKDEKYKDKDYLCNYRGYAKNGNVLKSSTFFIRDKKGKMIGMLCINTDCDKLIKIRDFLSSMIPLHENNKFEETEEISEKLSLNAEEFTLESIQKTVNETGVDPERMSQQEKIDVVKKLQDMGIFLLKGAVAQTAATLKVSEPTVYRYLNQIKRE
jgi:predicted transcriptional regulator YheO